MTILAPDDFQRIPVSMVNEGGAISPPLTYPEVPPQVFPTNPGGTNYNDALPIGQAIPVPTSPTTWALPDAPGLPGGVPVNVPGITNTTGGMVAGGMNSASSTTTANIDWYSLLNALGFNKASSVSTQEAVSPASGGTVQTASLIPTMPNMTTFIYLGFILIIVYFIVRH